MDEKVPSKSLLASSRRFWIPLLICVLAVLVGGGLGLATSGFDPKALVATAMKLLDWVAQLHPTVLLLALAILPCVGMPVSPLLIAGGLAYGIPVGLTIGFVGIALNDALAYLLAAYPLRRFIEGLIHSRGWKIPEIPQKEETRIIIVLRITPGLPLPIQNYLLGMARVPFGKYMVLSMLAQSLPIIAFTVTGGSLFEGSWGLIILGVILIVVMTLIAKIAYGMFGSKVNLTAGSAEKK